MKILVTGGLGFIGSNFILHTLEKYPDFEITNIDAGLSGSNVKNLLGLKNKKYSYVKGDIINKKIVDNLVSRTDIVINLDRSDNSLNNCEGLCSNCHTVKTLEN